MKATGRASWCIRAKGLIWSLRLCILDRREDRVPVAIVADCFTALRSALDLPHGSIRMAKSTAPKAPEVRWRQVARVSRSLACQFAVLALSLTIGACSKRTSESIRLSEFVAHQRWNFSTDLIAADKQIGLEHLGFGWRFASNKISGRTWFEFRRGAASVHFFSADADTSTIEFEAGLKRSEHPGIVRVDVRINHRSIGVLDLARRWNTYALEVPGGTVQTGINTLDLEPLDAITSVEFGSKPIPRLRRIRFISETDRPLWLDRPERIRATDQPDGDSAKSRIDLPIPGFLDLVFDVGSHARLLGQVSVVEQNDSADAPVEIYASILEENGDETTVLSLQEAGQLQTHPPFEVPLERWSGQGVRLRLGVTGKSNGIARLSNVRIVQVRRSHRDTPTEVIEVKSAPRSGRLGRPDVLVVVLDAARADAFSPFGGPYPTPFLDSLAMDGTAFDDAIAASSWSAPSMASILTGLYPDTLGVSTWDSPIPSEVPTIPELMQAAGYRCVLWSQHPFYFGNHGYLRGFTTSVEAALGDTELLPTAKDLISDQGPTFSVVHLMLPHTPYEPPPPFRNRYSGWYSGSMSVDAKFLNRADDPRKGIKIGDESLAYIRDRYLENAAFADRQIGAILQLYKDRDRYSSSLIVVLSDHGEAFREHGSFLHGQNLHREVLHVPLIVKLPESIPTTRRVVREPVSLLDLAPTLVDGMALPDGGPGQQGRSLLGVLLDGERRSGPQYAVTRGSTSRSRPPGQERMLQTDPWRAIYDVQSDTTKLYRPQVDPLEETDVADQYPMRALMMRQAVLRQSAANRELLMQMGGESDRGEEISPELTDKLEALGYLN